MDEEGKPILKARDKDRFIVGRDGDHFMVPFQCELCHFRNIQGRNPIMELQSDDMLLEFARRASLDAFWKSEPATVKTNTGAINRIIKTQQKFQMHSLLPQMGPNPLEDTWGMGQAIAVLDKSLDKGRYASNVQWSTFRKTCSALTNAFQAGVGGLNERVGAYEKNKTWISGSPTFNFTFTRFAEGCHKRVGEIVMRDEPVSIHLMKALDFHLESKWNDLSAAPNPNLHLLSRLATQGAWFFGGFCSGLRGEEMLLLEFNGTNKSLRYLDQYPPDQCSHFELVVSGRTKGQRLSGSKFSIPVAGTTTKSYLRPGLWMKRYCSLMTQQGKNDGFLFDVGNADDSKLSDFHDIFYEPLEELQEYRPDIIPDDVDVREAYGILRSLRRGVTAHALNMRIPDAIIASVNRWRTERNNDVPTLDMPSVYARLDYLKPTVLRYSESL